MKAMIFAAGLGSRLRPHTDKIPKALIQINNKPLLEIVITKLKHHEVKEIIINTHHFADQISDFLQRNNNFDIHIETSYEPELLDTGGGLKQAAWFFKDEPCFIVHNVDIISDIDLKEMLHFHRQSGAIATLAVQKRDSSRQLLFDKNMILQGWQNRKTNEIITSGFSSSELKSYAFSGIQVLSPQFFAFFPDKKVFSTIEAFLHAAQQQAIIKGWIPGHNYWLDLGKTDQLKKAEKLLKHLNG